MCFVEDTEEIEAGGEENGESGWRTKGDLDSPRGAVHSPMKVATQVDWEVKKAFGTFAITSQGIERRSWNIMPQLCRTL